MAVKKTGENLIGKGKAGPGRPKGATNKTTRLAKDAIAEAAEGLGGADRMIAWAKEDPANERAFWATIYPKLVPVQVAGPDDDEGKPTEIVMRIVRSNG